MLDMQRVSGIAGSILAGLAVVCGAFGAHALRDRLGVDALAIWRTAVDYQFWHALAVLAIAGSPLLAFKPARVAVWAFVIGIVLFSGSLYALAFGAPRATGMITPIGGGAFLVGWIALVIGFARKR